MNRDEYFAKMHAQLGVWQQKLDNLESSIQDAKESTKEEYSKQIQDLKTKIDTAEQKLDKAKSSSSSAWDDMKDGIQKSFDELKNGFDSALKNMRK